MEIKAKSIFVKPYITERSTRLSGNRVFTFIVKPSANKVLIKKAIKELYGFDPIKINIVNIPARKKIARGKIGRKPGFKKALVYLKEGDKIEFV